MTTQSQGGASSPVSGRAAVALIGTLVSIYVVSQFLRTSVGVIAPDLVRDVGLSASDLGLLSSAFFFTFAAAQLPLGVALDRFGPRACLLVCGAITIAGSVVFATASSATGLTLGRALLGLGCASAFMAPLTIYARRFPPDRFATLTGFQLGFGSTGALLATAPLAYSAAMIGWRASFLLVGVVTLLAMVLVALVVREQGPTGPAKQESLSESIAGIISVMRTPSCGRLFLMHLTGYSSFALIVGLWGGPYFSHIYGHGLQERGQLLLIPAFAQIIGLLIWGPMDRLMGSYKRPVALGAGMTVVALGALAYLGKPDSLALLVWLGVFGFVSAYIPVMIAHGRSLFPPHLVGRGITLLNMGTMGGVFLSQIVTGAVIDLFPTEQGAYPLDAYRLVFALQAAFLLTAIVAYLGTRDPLCGKNRQIL